MYDINGSSDTFTRFIPRIETMEYFTKVFYKTLNFASFFVLEARECRYRKYHKTFILVNLDELHETLKFFFTQIFLTTVNQFYSFERILEYRLKRECTTHEKQYIFCLYVHIKYLKMIIFISIYDFFYYISFYIHLIILYTKKIFITCVLSINII